MSSGVGPDVTSLPSLPARTPKEDCPHSICLRNPTTILWDMFPHIFELILHYADVPLLKVMRQTCRVVCHMATPILRFRHIELVGVVGRGSRGYFYINSKNPCGTSPRLAYNFGNKFPYFNSTEGQPTWDASIQQHTQIVDWKIDCLFDQAQGWSRIDDRGAAYLGRLFASVETVYVRQGDETWCKAFPNLRQVAATLSTKLPVIPRPHLSVSHYVVVVQFCRLLHKPNDIWSGVPNHCLENLHSTRVTFVLLADAPCPRWITKFTVLMKPYVEAKSLTVRGPPELLQLVASEVLPTLHLSPSEYEHQTSRALIASSHVKDTLQLVCPADGTAADYYSTPKARQVIETLQALGPKDGKPCAVHWELGPNCPVDSFPQPDVFDVLNDQ